MNRPRLFSARPGCPGTHFAVRHVDNGERDPLSRSSSAMPPRPSTHPDGPEEQKGPPHPPSLGRAGRGTMPFNLR